MLMLCRHFFDAASMPIALMPWLLPCHYAIDAAFIRYAIFALSLMSFSDYFYFLRRRADYCFSSRFLRFSSSFAADMMPCFSLLMPRLLPKMLIFFDVFAIDTSFRAFTPPLMPAADTLPLYFRRRRHFAFSRYVAAFRRRLPRRFSLMLRHFMPHAITPSFLDAFADAAD